MSQSSNDFDTGFKYYFWNHPERYESGVCWIAKPSNRRVGKRTTGNQTRELLKP